MLHLFVFSWSNDPGFEKLNLKVLFSHQKYELYLTATTFCYFILIKRKRIAVMWNFINIKKRQDALVRTVLNRGSFSFRFFNFATAVCFGKSLLTCIMPGWQNWFSSHCPFLQDAWYCVPRWVCSISSQFAAGHSPNFRIYQLKFHVW